MKTICDIEYLEGVKVLVRADFNVPVRAGVVAEDFRIKAALPTIGYLRQRGAKVILISHAETNDGKNISLKPVADRLEKFGVPVNFIKDFKNAHEIIESPAHKDNDGHNSAFLLENLRYFEGEKENDNKFAKELASLGDIFVNEAFSVSHREHASIVGVPKFLPSYAGLQFEKEVENLRKAFNPPHPFLFILGGAKFETKIPLLKRFLDIADSIFVGGALANDFFKQKGYEIGHSLVSKSDLNLSDYANNPKIILPLDVIDSKNNVWPAVGFPTDEKIMDAGRKTLEMLQNKISQSKFILWNGPLGLYEDGYRGSTIELAKIIGAATAKGKADSNGVISTVGGGDTVAAIASLGIEGQFTFVSTGGGAMLDFLAKGTLPGIEALEKSKI